MLWATASGNSCLSAISLTATRPPGLRTRAISRKTAGGRCKIDDAIRDDAVHGRIWGRNLIDGGLVELTVCVAASLSVGPRPLDHGGGHVDANGTTLRSDHLRGKEHVKAQNRPPPRQVEVGSCRGIAA